MTRPASIGRTLPSPTTTRPDPAASSPYLQNLVDLLPPEQVVVYAPRWRGRSHLDFDEAAPYPSCATRRH